MSGNWLSVRKHPCHLSTAVGCSELHEPDLGELKESDKVGRLCVLKHVPEAFSGIIRIEW